MLIDDSVLLIFIEKMDAHLAMWNFERTACAMKEENWARKRFMYLYSSRYGKLYATRPSGYATSNLSADEIYLWEMRNSNLRERDLNFQWEATLFSAKSVYTLLSGALQQNIDTLPS